MYLSHVKLALKNTLQNLFIYFRNGLKLWGSRQFIYSALFSFLILYVSTLINSLAGLSATQQASSPVTDIILSNIGRIDTSFIHGEVTTYVRDITLLLLFLMPRYLPFAMKSMALLSLIRDLFINMTHIGIYPDAIPLSSFATFGGDLFFSGHVATSVLMALVFWDNKYFRYLFIFIALLLGTSALLGHYHYTIDVFSAPFIAYGVFVIAKKLFHEDMDLLQTHSYQQVSLVQDKKTS